MVYNTYNDNKEHINDCETYKNESCVICLENIPDVLFCSCGHICICKYCYKKQTLEKCPICKTKNTILRIV